MMSLKIAPRHPCAVTWSRHALGVSPARSARRLARQWLTHHGCGVDLIEAVELVVTELVANAVKHCSYTTGLSLYIVHPTDHAEGALHIAVHDPGPGESLRAVASTETERGLRECGRGLAIVAALSRAWGVVRHDAQHKQVWCELPIPQYRSVVTV
ncbi:ATP-binding protein [Streptomyces sp. NPDC056149]|uniref:ATP-binding protein n=1 Tax=unclassified Streptomyces TaxID=2593676 RepID=UPI00238115D4|nr:ATP-binding protein [Streptomyces sp. WZ-12]